MKYSIIIPTQDRSDLLAVAVSHAMQAERTDFEVIVSDNSTSPEHRTRNLEVLREYLPRTNFRVIAPMRVLSAPEHFDFALDGACGDYVTYLTDKMALLPTTLSAVDEVVRQAPTDIVNWAYAPYAIDDPRNPAGAGTLTEDMEFLENRPSVFDPMQALRFKASGKVSRDQQTTRDYALGKIVFGFYSRALINRIREKSGTLFGGATHDYSAMIQALSLAGRSVMLDTYGVLFISLPRDKSLGSLTATDAQWALRYFRAFSDCESILMSLLVPGLYASQHNMVAHDYKKFLPLYNNEHLFDHQNWLRSIADDLHSKDRVWSDAVEMQAQLTLLSEYLARTGQTPSATELDVRDSLVLRGARRVMRALRYLISRLSGETSQPRFHQTHCQSLHEAVHHLVAHQCHARGQA